MKRLSVLVCSILFLVTNIVAKAYVVPKVYKVSDQTEFKKAATMVVAGDEIVILNGNYSGWELTVHTNGTAEKPILIRAETAGKVIFSGAVNKAVFKLTGSYTEISGLSFVGCELFKTPGNVGVLIELNGTSYCRITDCSFSKNVVKSQFMPIVVVAGKGEHNRVDHCSFMGNIDNQELKVTVTADEVPLYTLIDQNVFKDKEKVSWKGTNGGECVQIGQDPVLLGTQYPRAIVRENRFVHCDGEAEVISNKSSGNTYADNYFEDCKGELVMRGGHECVIEKNMFKGGTGGIRVNGTQHTIINNSFNNLPIAIRLMYGMAKSKTEIGFYIAASDCMIKHNQISHCGTGILIGDSKNADWTGKFDTARYPSRTMQDVAPFNNIISDNNITDTKVPELHNEG